MKKTLSLLLLIIITFSSCEKDDICSATTSTTPRLVIQFYDISNPTVLKNASNLKIIGDGMTDELAINGNANTVSIPFKTTENSIKYRFILNSNSTTFSNEDVLQFDYSRENVYVSRACGFKTIFDLDPANPYSHTDSSTPDGFWIQAITIEKKSIDNENETHVKIYF